MAVGEWDQRELCPDGACIGVIGPEGTCKVCGRAAVNWGDERNRGLINPEEDDELAADGDADDGDHDDPDDDDDDDADDGGDDDLDDDDDEVAGDDVDEVAAASERAVAGATAGSPAGWSGRQLCPEGSCIGLIGSDGRCKVCGRTARGTPADAGEPASATGAPAATGEAMATAAGTATADASAADASAATAADHERCSDASCTGTVGADGRCQVCGKGAS